MLPRIVPIKKISFVVQLILWFRSTSGGDFSTQQQQDKVASRASQYDATNLKCQIGSQRSGIGQPLSFQDFEYWYAMGTIATIDSIQMFNLEQLLYNKVEDDMVWCWEDVADTTPTKTTTTVVAATAAAAQSEHEERRTTQQQQRYVSNPGRKRLEIADSRNLNIITFTPGNMDRQTKRKFLSFVQNKAMQNTLDGI
jgi:hypothetical protein